ERPHKLLDGPTVAEKPCREVLEQLRVRGGVAGHAEIVDRSDDPLVKQVLPDAVDDYPRREWIPGAGQPLRQLQPPALLPIDLRGARRFDGGEKTARCGRADLFRLAANADLGIADDLGFPHSVDDVAAGRRVSESEPFRLELLILKAVRPLF